MTDANDTTGAPAYSTPFYLDKALWVVVLTPILLIINQKFGFTIDANAVLGFVLPAVAYILGHKWKTGTLQKAQIAADAASADVKTVSDAAKVLNNG